MLTWHTAGGTGSEPSILLLRKPLLGVADRTRLHERRSHLQVQVRDGDACLEWLPIAFPFTTGPRVRIRLPPAASRQTIGSSAAEHGVFVQPLLSGEVWIGWDHVARMLDALRQKRREFVALPGPRGEATCPLGCDAKLR